MVKVRFDIVVFTIVWTFLLILVTYFIPPYEKTLFKELDLIGGYNGYPATEYVDEVTTLAEIEAAAENYDEFAIKVDSDNVKATNYFAYSNPTSSLMNASGHSFCYVSEVSDKRDSMYNLTWAIIAGGMVIYTIASTVAILNAKRKARKNQ